MSLVDGSIVIRVDDVAQLASWTQALDEVARADRSGGEKRHVGES
ncbi:MAG: hypothetical protein QM622_09025 [Microbacterium sp.]